jgi:hypothetical protein
VAKSKQGKMYAILARCQRTGRWRLAPRFALLAFLGACRLDLRRAIAEGDTSKVKLTVLLGSASVMLPPGAEIRPSGLAFLSASSVDIPETDEGSDLPVIEIEWTAILGRVRIGTESTLEPHEDVKPTEEKHADPVPATVAPGPDPEPETTVEPDPEPEPEPSIGFDDFQPEPETTPEPEPASA